MQRLTACAGPSVMCGDGIGFHRNLRGTGIGQLGLEVQAYQGADFTGFPRVSFPLFAYSTMYIM
jgi:hypothetical protein